jgi:arylsulfatase A-like enzyme
VDARPVSSLDIAATAAAAAGVIHPKAEGIDLVRLLSEPAKPTGRTLFWRMGPTKIVRDEHWKLLVINKGAPPQATPDGAPSDDLGKSLRPDGMTASVSELGQWTLLYDMRTDPGETRNVAELHPEVVRDLLARWDAWNTGNVTPQWTSRRGVNAMVDAMRVELFN